MTHDLLNIQHISFGINGLKNQTLQKKIELTFKLKNGVYFFSLNFLEINALDFICVAMFIAMFITKVFRCVNLTSMVLG
jgi:hypothetical protein